MSQNLGQRLLDILEMYRVSKSQDLLGVGRDIAAQPNLLGRSAEGHNVPGPVIEGDAVLVITLTVDHFVVVSAGGGLLVGVSGVLLLHLPDWGTLLPP